jgi:hypothetical protein
MIKGRLMHQGDYIANQPDTLQKMTNSLLVNVDIPINTKRLKELFVSM